MGKGIYTYYKERLIDIGGKNKCLYLKNVARKSAYDIGRIFEGREEKVNELIKFLWSAGKEPLSLISREESREVAENLGIADSTENIPAPSISEDGEKEQKKRTRKISSDRAKMLETEVAKIKELKREVEGIERETGKYELYIGYPFVFGSIQQGPTKTLIKAPLMLFPVKIDIVDEETVDIKINSADKVQINKALILAYAQSKKLNIDELETEFDDLSSFKNLSSVIQYLADARIRIECKPSKYVYNYARFKEPEHGKGDLSIRYAAILGRFPISNSVYSDYSVLEKKNLTNDAIDELLYSSGKFAKSHRPLIERVKALGKPLKAKRFPTKASYIVKMLDYAQSEVVKKVDQTGNMVIYGPPGTGKSQTIVNIITDALSKKKRVLVVSQKKAALDVVYSRLGVLNEKAVYINDESKERHAFYERCYNAHKQADSNAAVPSQEYIDEYTGLQDRIDQEEKMLCDIYHLLNDKRRPFGLSLSEMYSSSYMLQKNSPEYVAYLQMIRHKDVMSLTYKELSNAMFTIKANNITETYYTFAKAKAKNPIIDSMRHDIDINTIAEVKEKLDEIQRSRKGFFNISKYPYTRQVLAHYAMLENPAAIHTLAKMESRLENYNTLFKGASTKSVERQMKETLEAISEFVKEYDCLNKVMTKDGYISVIDNVLRGNTAYLKLVEEALDNFITQRDISRLLGTLSKNMLDILNFAYEASNSYSNYLDIVDKIPMIRMYHELTVYEDKLKDELIKIVDFPNITARIYKLKEAQLAVSHNICKSNASKEYKELYSSAENAKDYLYQISKDKKHWPIRKTMEIYGNFIFSLFPCWLLSPENVSSLLPLEKNLFDIVIFDEASQVFIESTIPTIYRGKNIVVAGDAKQLRPSATFMKRYLGADVENMDDYSVQAALEVESLLDLAVSRYDSANLTYHYRSRHQELIDFSNNAFYSGGLQVAPNIYTGKSSRPIERYKVDGSWIDRKNQTEARKVVEIIQDIFATRKENESIGIITFNSDQQACIEDAIDKEAQRDSKFRARIAKEKARTDDGEDTGLFIKNLENVQGDERDIIIFSIGYAPNEQGRVYTNFGSLSSEGGENRLNVAITRAKAKIIVVTSIEPEELKVDSSKNLGPKLLRDYLFYVRSVSNGDKDNAKAILDSLVPTDKYNTQTILSSIPSIEEQIKQRLELLGYKVDIGLGNANSRISLAVYDAECDKYLIGIELDKDAFAASSSAMERDVYKPKFLEGRGWKIMRVWCRDWWISPARVVRSIVNAAEKNRTQGTPPKAIIKNPAESEKEE